MITSRNPVVRPPVEEKSFNDMKVVMLRASWDGHNTRVKAQLQNWSEQLQELDPGGERFLVKVDSIGDLALLSVRISDAVDEINEIISLAYGVQYIETQISEATSNGFDTTQLEADLIVAQRNLLAPKPEAR